MRWMDRRLWRTSCLSWCSGGYQSVLPQTVQQFFAAVLWFSRGGNALRYQLTGCRVKPMPCVVGGNVLFDFLLLLKLQFLLMPHLFAVPELTQRDNDKRKKHQQWGKLWGNIQYDQQRDQHRSKESQIVFRALILQAASPFRSTGFQTIPSVERTVKG